MSESSGGALVLDHRQPNHSISPPCSRCFRCAGRLRKKDAIRCTISESLAAGYTFLITLKSTSATPRLRPATPSGTRQHGTAARRRAGESPPLRTRPGTDVWRSGRPCAYDHLLICAVKNSTTRLGPSAFGANGVMECCSSGREKKFGAHSCVPPVLCRRRFSCPSPCHQYSSPAGNQRSGNGDSAFELWTILKSAPGGLDGLTQSASP